MNVVRPHGAKAREDLSERRHDVVLQVAEIERETSTCSCIHCFHVEINPCLAGLNNNV